MHADTAPVQKVLGISQRLRESHAHQRAELDDLGRRLEVPIVVCLTTGLVVLVTGAWLADVLMGIGITSLAFESVFHWFSYILCISVILFAFSAAVSCAYYGSKAVGYLSGDNRRADVIYKLALCGVLSVGATIELANIVNFIDAMLFGTAVSNLLAVFILLPELKRDLHRYAMRKKGVDADAPTQP